MQKASRLFELIKEGLASKSLSSVEILRQSKIEESLVSLTEKFSIRDAVMQRSSDPSRITSSSSDENNNIAFFNTRNEKSRKVLSEQQRQFHSTLTVDGDGNDSGIGGEVNRDGDGGDDNNGNSVSLATKGDEDLSASTSKPMLLSLTSVFGGPDNEPQLTNWNGDFKGSVANHLFISC